MLKTICQADNIHQHKRGNSQYYPFFIIFTSVLGIALFFTNAMPLKLVPAIFILITTKINITIMVF